MIKGERMEDRIEIYLLEHLSAMSDCHTLAEAAEALNITQPTLTRSMQKIERILGVQLFLREHNRLYLNENGKIAVVYASRILEMENEMIGHVRMTDQRSRMITVGSCTPGPILEVVRDLQVMYPDKKIVSDVKLPYELLSGLAAEEYQMIIMDRPVDMDGYSCSFWGTEQLYISVIPDHPAAGRDAVSFSDFNGQKFPVMANLGAWRTVIDREMPDSQFYPQTDLNVLMEIADSSTLPVFDSESRIRVFGESSKRIAIPVSDQAGTMECYCVCRSKDLKLFRKWFF